MSLLWLRKWSVAVVAATVLIPSTVGAAPKSPPNGKPKIDNALTDATDHKPKERVPVIIQIVPGGELAVQGRLAALGRRITGDFGNIRAYGAKVNAAELQELIADPAVASVSFDVPVHAHALVGTDALMTLDLVRADLGSVAKGVTGNGVGVAVIDTGIAGDLPDFRVSSTDTSSRVVAAVVTNPDATTATDTYGHGTHVAGIPRRQR